MNDTPDLFTPKPEPIDVEAARRHARQCFFNFVGRWPMSPEERAEIQHRKGIRAMAMEASRITTGKLAVMDMETRFIERNPEYADTKGMPLDGEDEHE